MRREDHVRGLHVAVEDAVAVTVSEGAGEGETDLDDARPAQPAAPAHGRRERLAVDLLDREPAAPFDLAARDEARDRRVIEARQRVLFTLRSLVVLLGALEELDRDLAAARVARR